VQEPAVYRYATPETEESHLWSLVGLVLGATTLCLLSVYAWGTGPLVVPLVAIPSLLLAWQKQRLATERVVLADDRLIYYWPLGRRPLIILYNTIASVNLSRKQALDIETYLGQRVCIGALEEIEPLKRDLDARLTAARAVHPAPFIF
jgi:hypothetical protein